MLNWGIIVLSMIIMFFSGVYCDLDYANAPYGCTLSVLLHKREVGASKYFWNTYNLCGFDTKCLGYIQVVLVGIKIASCRATRFRGNVVRIFKGIIAQLAHIMQKINTIVDACLDMLVELIHSQRGIKSFFYKLCYVHSA